MELIATKIELTEGGYCIDPWDVIESGGRDDLMQIVNNAIAESKVTPDYMPDVSNVQGFDDDEEVIALVGETLYALREKV